MAAFYVGLARWMRSRPQFGLTFDASLAIGTVFLTLVIPFALDARSTAGAWALEGPVWSGSVCASAACWRARSAICCCCSPASRCSMRASATAVPVAVFNAYLFNALMAAAASWAAAFFVQRHAERAASHPSEGHGEPLLIGCGTLWLVSAAALEIETFVPAPFRSPPGWLRSVRSRAVRAPSVRLAGIASPGRRSVTRRSWRWLRSPAAASLTSPAQGGGWWAWPIAFAVHAAILWFIAPRWPEPLRHAITPSASSCSARSARCRAEPSPAAGARRPARGRGSAGSSFRRCC
jgi:hypothetical protein